MKIEERTRAAEGRVESRNKIAEGIAYAGVEAQWTLFDPLLSEFYGRRYLQTGSAEDRSKQLMYLNRSLAQFIATPDGPRLPESFYYTFQEGVNQWVPNDHTPLLWSQANLLRALNMFERTH
jgi:phosphorylase kinase alpha/beta subunit